MALGEDSTSLPFPKLSSVNSSELSFPPPENSINSNIRISKQHVASLNQTGPSSTPHICSSCQNPILDEFLSSVSNQWWHESCLKCAECEIQLSETCYSREGRTYCREDFYRYQKLNQL